MKALPTWELNQLSVRYGVARDAWEEEHYLWVAIMRLYPSLTKQAGRALASTFIDGKPYEEREYLINWTDESLEFACEQVALAGHFLWNGKYWSPRGFGRKSMNALWDAIQLRHE